MKEYLRKELDRLAASGFLTETVTDDDLYQFSELLLSEGSEAAEEYLTKRGVSQMNWKITDRGKWGFTVEILVRMRRNATGEIREYAETCLMDERAVTPSPFDYEENNNSCNCNRFLNWERAAGKEPDWDLAECGEGEFSVRLLHPISREAFYAEF